MKLNLGTFITLDHRSTLSNSLVCQPCYNNINQLDEHMTEAEKMKSEFHKIYNQTLHGVKPDVKEEKEIEIEDLITVKEEETDVFAEIEPQDPVEEYLDPIDTEEPLMEEEYLDEEFQIEVKEEPEEIIVEIDPPPNKKHKIFNDPLPSTSSIFSILKADMERVDRINEQKGMEKQMVRDNFITKKVKDGEVYTCKTCVKTFSKKEAIKLHVKTHLNKGWNYECQECSKTFQTPMNLKSHLRRHEELKGLRDRWTW